MDSLTIPEYELLMEAEQLKQVDTDYRTHLLAWLTFAAKAEKKAGKGKTKPVYGIFEKFYDYKKELKKVSKKNKESNNRFAGIGRFLNKKE